LPAEGATATAVIDRLSLNFSEDMAAPTVLNMANFDLRAAGPDGQFGTADDQVYSLASYGYTSGLTASLRITDGPLQPGTYRFTRRPRPAGARGNSAGDDIRRRLRRRGRPVLHPGDPLDRYAGHRHFAERGAHPRLRRLVHRGRHQGRRHQPLRRRLRRLQPG